MTSLGFLYPGRTAADDYPRMEQLIGSDIRLYLVHADGSGTHTTGPVAEDGPGLDAGAVPVPTGSADRLAAVGEELRLSGAEAVVWAGPGFALGPEGAKEQVRALARAAGLPASSTSFGFVHAVREVGARRVAVASVYTPVLTGLFTDFLAAAGTEVVSVAHGSADDLVALAVEADHPDAGAVLVPGTAVRSAAQVSALEERLGKPVLTANQVTVWEGLRLTDRRVNAPGLGALFTREPVVQAPPSR
ncbi:decarboxylase [Streptomyces uncialis]|uniref:maleate cis-trans isomerase family protein n=1 Tax=Streptomyces uncialis TaxID=1048205 RepID=UPI00381B91E4